MAYSLTSQGVEVYKQSCLLPMVQEHVPTVDCPGLTPPTYQARQGTVAASTLTVPSDCQLV